MKTRKMTSVLIALAMSFALFAGCSKKDADSGDNTFITIKGSDTMAHLVASWAEEFGKSNTGIDVSFTGGGSGTGIAAILNGTTDICAASREVKDKEIKQANDKGITLTELVVARDGIAVIVNPANPVNEMTIEQIGKIYTGATPNWSTVGGVDMPVEILSRESSSGTYSFFQDVVLNKKDYAVSAKLMPATSAIVQAVTENKGAIGYVGLGYALAAKGKVKIIAVKADASTPAVVPSDASIKEGTYSVARGLQFYTNGEPTGNIKKFLDYCLSSAGQKIVQETGYVVVK
ncbi:MAG: PstS family phosphate ABC transporter substrate-binding protein [Phycisphaerae bacterium]|nr:PstS family phosphate ABC transporter substrate-binding protein [Phycisphaerae bacterium]